MSTRQISFAIQGMFCARCAVNIEHALAQLDGVVGAHVNYATEHSTVTYEPARIHVAQMLEAVRHVGFDIRLEHLTLNVDDLLYATSARTVEQVLSRADGVAQASVDLRARRVMLDVLPERSGRHELEDALAQLSLHVVEAPSPNVAREFVVRGLVAAALALVLDWGAVNHLGIFSAASELPAALMLGALAMLAMFGAGWPLYRRAYAALTQGEFDASIVLTLIASVAFLCGVVLALLSPGARPVWGWQAWSGFISAALTAIWFIARGVSLWRLPHVPHTDSVSQNQLEAFAMTTVTNSTTPVQVGWRRWLLPPLVGVISTLALIGLYLGIISIAQGPSHALEQLAQDQLWVGLVALGFGTQVGLYTYLRLVVQALKLAGVTALTGVGTGTSTLGMIACCAHHVTDFAPLVALAGASGLSGAVTFLAEWKIPFIIVGLIVNVIGIVVTLRTIRTSRAYLKSVRYQVSSVA